jgi:hypothetical protein
MRRKRLGKMILLSYAAEEMKKLENAIINCADTATRESFIVNGGRDGLGDM